MRDRNLNGSGNREGIRPRETIKTVLGFHEKIYKKEMKASFFHHVLTCIMMTHNTDVSG